MGQSEASSGAIRLSSVAKRFGSVEAVKDVTLEIAAGEFFALLGPSGCGKSTTLRLLAGLEQPDEGAVHFGAKLVADRTNCVAPEHRGVGLVFQDYALFPHLTVRENIGFGLRELSRFRRSQRVNQLAEMVGIDGLTGRYPHELSGGQQQRVALARAMANRPTLMLLDEPFSNLDAALRSVTRDDVKAVLAAEGITTVLVTHDREEALSLADRVGVMHEGVLAQVGTPEEIYHNPRTRDVATLGGAATFLTGTAHGATVECELGILPLAQEREGSVEIMIRPEALRLHSNSHGRGRVEKRSFLGPYQQISVRLPSGAVIPVRADAAQLMPIASCCEIRVNGPVVAF